MTQPKTILITGAAGGIGLATSRHFNTLHPTSTIILTDLPTHQEATESLIQSTFPHPEKAVFLPANITDWGRMTHLFRTIAQKYGGVDVVVANAGMMESTPVLDLEDIDEETGELRESLEARRVVDVNLMGTLNTLRLAMYHMKEKEKKNGSIVLVASTSGYFGGTGVTAYVASKHGVVGLLRASQVTAQKYGIRVNAVAPFMTPTRMTAGLSQSWQDAGLEANTPERVAEVIEQVGMDTARRGSCMLVSAPNSRSDCDVQSH
ncbi:hypothetical protein AnigIFM63604_000063 [Aspergillus niger]|uniref:Ketoreductase domain-containing protein n=1 Tax=Aspergillus niger TaxID=5061 RepID=A0A9W5ZU16_ASPNG|nr:short chain dehydrogenase/reductase [Aspergillus niger]GLA44776.1 hypothetical protein AnigIFM63604_000063 [Aspergillus niger]